ncbi:hypothetical protein DTO166G4_7772 [Paecilomyces variotii]|uniref:Mid2 domain-containing protein n=1 Tax=Byssochlamys spectabilis TaxID=264951 RepID=A0A443I798_BYSSP|nr:hypothetical protein C8Q69DRAFT_503477 [Paecilomyces variotii]KAJ9191954.1 hypothetical protein DTO164E3_8604 [Paecilomyces variotii]KAJ9210629.1 hypothetical protein DTO166G4_7772 [Paecilomyces variotii]KAJ9223915.1 hypothetical protein DTO169C6_3785 [Paecilomyces variotii]KAJ9228735.1 hypothetical protein DTO166G5_8364 [Paecilomyces variotii]KAJ9271947.1 hypothetical protein DTO212C5_2028 [Paecilomyces variotii]
MHIMKPCTLASRVATTLLIASNLISVTVAIQCYSHNGVEANSSEFYNATRDGQLIGCGTAPTTCCLENEYCDIDLLCHDRTDGGVSRQYCSDPSWPPDACSALCPDYGAAGVALTQCDDAGTKFCCGPDNTACCDAGNYTQINQKGQIIAIGTSTIQTSSTSTTTASSSSTNPASTAATTTASSAAATRATASSTSASNSASSSATKLGAGLGVGLGVPFIIALGLAVYFWKRSSQNKKGTSAAAAAAGAEDPMQHTPAAGGLYRYSGSPDNKKDTREEQQMLMNVERRELQGSNAAHELP